MVRHPAGADLTVRRDASRVTDPLRRHLVKVSDCARKPSRWVFPQHSRLMSNKRIRSALRFRPIRVQDVPDYDIEVMREISLGVYRLRFGYWRNIARTHEQRLASGVAAGEPVGPGADERGEGRRDDEG